MVHITAHSGCDGTPDNSLEFVRYALQTRADALEVDVRKTEDGGLAISHDAIVPGQDAPSLDAVFELVAQSDKWVNCDLKQPDLENAVIDLAKKHGLLQRLIFSGTVSLERVRTQPELTRDVLVYINIEELMPGLYEQLKEEERIELSQIRQAAALCREYGLRVLNVYEKLCTPQFMQIMEQEGVRVSAWTVDDPARAAELAAAPAIENITSRVPETLLRVIHP